MSFSRLLLVAANSKKYITGAGNDKVIISPKRSELGKDAYEGEVVLCFQLDEPNDPEKRVARSLGIPEEDKRCDGLVFYSQDGYPNRVICLVEMKRTNVDRAENQIVSTKERIEELLRKECEALPEIAHIQWKACLYHYGASPDDVNNVLSELKKNGNYSGVLETCKRTGNRLQ